MTTLLDPRHFQTLAQQNPEDVCRRALCTFNPVSNCYRLSVWGEEYRIYPGEARIDRVVSQPRAPHEYLFVFILHYLLQVKDLELGRRWISEKDIPGGATFFRGPHAIPTNEICTGCQGKIELFKELCSQLNGSPIDMADAAYVFTITPRLPVAVLFWQGDEEFPAEAKLLYDNTVSVHLALDGLFALAVDICTRLGTVA